MRNPARSSRKTKSISSRSRVRSAPWCPPRRTRSVSVSVVSIRRISSLGAGSHSAAWRSGRRLPGSSSKRRAAPSIRAGWSTWSFLRMAQCAAALYDRPDEPSLRSAGFGSPLGRRAPEGLDTNRRHHSAPSHGVCSRSFRAYAGGMRRSAGSFLNPRAARSRLPVRLRCRCIAACSRLRDPAGMRLLRGA